MDQEEMTINTKVKRNILYEVYNRLVTEEEATAIHNDIYAWKLILMRKAEVTISDVEKIGDILSSFGQIIHSL